MASKYILWTKEWLTMKYGSSEYISWKEDWLNMFFGPAPRH